MAVRVFEPRGKPLGSNHRLIIRETQRMAASIRLRCELDGVECLA
jgi:hypothetical protein